MADDDDWETDADFENNLTEAERRAYGNVETKKNYEKVMDKSGSSALRLGVESGPQMTPECATVKLMLCLAYKDLPLGMPLAGEL